MSEKMGFESLRAKYKDVLSKAFSTNNIELLDSFSKNINDSDRKAAMDQAYRDKLLELLTEDEETLENYVSFCIDSCRRQMVTPTMPVVLLGDIFDALTLNKCEKIFTYVENGVSIWKEELFFVACKNNLLRMCNDLLRRLSRSQNIVFCGRILLFLAKFFPFSERSGLNIVSEFNLENVTEFGGDNTSTLRDSLDEEMMVEEEKTKLNIDYNLYCRFWSLQDFFRNPNTCYNKIQWKTFVAHSGSVLSAFSSYKLEAIELQKSKMNRVKPVHADADVPGAKEQHYFAKFLTNQKLLELQLSDSNFQRCVLIQFLILFQYLSSTVKFKMETQELKKDQADWVKETTALIYRLLGETPPDGQRFAECVQHILKREEHWNSWKNDGCPEFQKPPVPPAGEEEARRSKVRRRPLGDIVKEYEGQQKVYMGNNDLTKLWNLCPDNLAACRTKERDFMPSLHAYMATALPLGPGGARRTQCGAWGWRALRLLARRSPHFFIHTKTPIGRLPDYLDDMVKRVIREAAAEAGSGDAGAVKQELKQEPAEEEAGEEQMEEVMIKEEDNNDMDQVKRVIREAAAEAGSGDAGAVKQELKQEPAEEEAGEEQMEEVMIKEEDNNDMDQEPAEEEAGEEQMEEVMIKEEENNDMDQEPAEEEAGEEQMEEVMIKEEDNNDMDQVPDSTAEEGAEAGAGAGARVTPLSAAALEALAPALPEWRRLAAKLGFKPDEIQFFETEHATDELRATSMLRLWADDDEDASVEGLLYVLEGLGMPDACEALRNAK